MDVKNIEDWLDSALPKHGRLTTAAESIIENLLDAHAIDYLTISGRTKTKASALEKIQRKNYRDPSVKMTDLSGVRIVVFLESDVSKVQELIRNAFRVDEKNSSNKDDARPADQIGYRSVHVVCDLGDGRCALPEFDGLNGLKFEFQVRTVMQHAWAELAHDRNYKFSGKLPKSIERKMYLYAGMLEIADKGFDEIAREIDDYARIEQKKSAAGDFSSDINSISLRSFVSEWGNKNEIHINLASENKDDLSDLISELSAFGIKTLEDLNSIIPKEYAKICRDNISEPAIYGVVRDWMLMHDWRRFKRDVPHDWILPSEDYRLYQKVFDADELKIFLSTFEWESDTDFSDEDYL